ncbi:MAG: BatB protein [Gammaproteobacteria bacterium]|nr:MAG: BatB protein [Gammaproteobacteria bacterium]
MSNFFSHELLPVFLGAPGYLYWLPLPLLVRWILPPAHNQRSAALIVPFYAHVSTGGQEHSGKTHWKFIIALLVWSLLIIAASRPQWMSDPIEKPRSGRDIMLAVDLSASMENQDFMIGEQAIDRLSAVKMVVSDFIKRRQGDRLGLVFFASKAYVASPLTYDLTTVAELLNEAELRMIGKMTSIGDAVGLAVKRLHGQAVDQRVLILLSDGNNTSGVLPAERAAHFASLEGLTVYTIGMGAKVHTGRFGEPDIDHAGILNETTLKEVARLTDGQYFRAMDLDRLTQIYAMIDRLEPRVTGSEYFRKVEELYVWPLGAALVLSVLLALVLITVPVLSTWRQSVTYSRRGDASEPEQAGSSSHSGEAIK